MSNYEQSKCDVDKGRLPSNEDNSEDEDEQSSCGSSPPSPGLPVVHEDVQHELEHFLNRWQQELQVAPNYEQGAPNNANSAKTSGHNATSKNALEEEAKQLFMQGTEMEKNGHLYDAIKYYRRAMQLVPDVEFKIETYRHIRERQLSGNLSDIADNYDDSDKSDNEDENIKDGRLLAHIQRKMNKSPFFCIPRSEQRAVHISAIPSEILLYILKWVVSAELDIRSLEKCAQVSRGFYLLSRDCEIWRLICKAGGLDVAKLPSAFPTWRDLYLERERIFFNGCYISRTTYIRHGENSFQDQFYRPVHLVAYYRYLRFFPDGRVLMLNTPDEPALCVALLRARTPKFASGVLIGDYLQHDDRLTIVVAQQQLDSGGGGGGGGGVFGGGPVGRRNNAGNDVQGVASQTFHLELQIQGHNKQSAGQLTWRHYSVVTQHRNGAGAHCTFDIDSVKFPSLRFSRVKSYTQESNAPLS